MTAAFGKCLIFNLNHGSACTLKIAHGTLRVECIAKAGIGIDYHGQCNTVSDVRQGLRHFCGRGEANVRATQTRIGNRGTRQIQGFKPCLLGNQSAEGIVHTWCQQCFGLLQTLNQ